jgi:hypothetical protein
MRLTEFYQSCPQCGGPAFSDLILAEKKDACYHKVKASAKVWPSAYASGRLVQCRKKGAVNYGNKSEGVAEATGDEKFDKAMRRTTGDITPDDAAEMWPTQEFEPINLDSSYLPMMEKYKAKLFPLAYEYWTDGDNADELRALGWEPDYGDDYVMVVLSGIGHDGHIQYDKYDFDAEGENVTEAADNTAFRQGYERGIRYYRRGPQNPYKPGTLEFTDYNDGYQMGEADSYDKYDTSSMDENSR